MSYTEGKISKYVQIADDIRDMIKSGHYKKGDKILSEQELAEKYNVSRITTRKALDDLVSEGLIYRVRGSGSYVADLKDSTTQKSSIDMIAVILPFSPATGGGMSILQGAEEVANKHGYYISLHNSDGSRRKEREILLRLTKDSMKGIIYYPYYTAENFDLINMLVSEKYPIVMIDKYIYDIDMDCVVSDNFRGSYELTQYLIKLGHRNIAFFCDDYIDERSSLRERYLGYSRALYDNNIELNIENVVYEAVPEGPVSEKENLEYHAQLLERMRTGSTAVTAIEAASDITAIEMLNAAAQLGVKVPDDITIVGYDDQNIASMAYPPLTTIRQDFKGMGMQAAQLLLERIKDPNKKSSTIRLPVELVKRQSSKALTTQKTTAIPSRL
jgi:GntR family transcriptional regulator of arabinose operon